MKIKLPVLAALCLSALLSCKQTEKLNTLSRSTNSIKVPVGFLWKTSRSINVAVSVSDACFGTAIHIIAVYNGDPAKGGKIMSRGSATTTEAFVTKVTLSNQLSSVYIEKTSPDNSTSVTKVSVGTADVATTMGI